MKRKFIKESQGAAAVQALTAMLLESVAKKGWDWITGQVKQKVNEVGQTDQPETTEVDRERIFDQLANELSALGVTDPRLTDGKSLFNYLGTGEYRGVFFLKNYLEFIKLIRDTLNSVGRLKYKGLAADDVVFYALKLLKQNAFSLPMVAEQLKDLASKQSVFYDAYIISQFKSWKPGQEGQLASAMSSGWLLIGSILENGGKVDQKTQEQLQKLGLITNAMFGEKSADQMNSIALRTQQGELAFNILSTKRDLFQSLIPIAEESMRVKESVLQNLGEQYRDKSGIMSLVNSAPIRSIIDVAAGAKGVFDGVKGGAVSEAFTAQK